MSGTSETNEGVPIRGYLRVLRQWIWVVIGLFVVGLAAGTLWSFTRDEAYTAAADLLYEQPIDIGNPLDQRYTDTTQRQAELESIPSVVGSAEVVAKADEIMGPQTASLDHSVSVELEPGVDDTYTNVVTILGTAPTAQASADVANAYADGFVEWRRESVRAQIDQAIAVIEARLENFDTAAEQATTEYANLQSRLEDLRLLKATATGGFRVIQAASPPSSPSSPDHARNIAVGGVVGLLAGILAAFLAAQLDTRVRDEEQVIALLHQPVLGRVPALNGKNPDGGVLLTLADPSGPNAESYRLLRSNLDFMSVEDDIRSLMISSSLQREHKSVTACNLAVSLSLAGKRVVLVDGDLRSPRVHTYMNLGNASGVSTVVAHRESLQDALKRVVLKLTMNGHGTVGAGASRSTGTAGRGPKPEVESLVAPELGPVITQAECAPERCPAGMWDGAPDNSALLYVLTSGPLPPNPGELVSSKRLGLVIKELSEHADLVIIDAPAMLIVGDTAALANKVDGLLYVVDPRMVKRPQLQEAARQLGQLPCRKLGLVMVTTKSSSGYYGYRGYAERGDYKRGDRKLGRQ